MVGFFLVEIERCQIGDVWTLDRICILMNVHVYVLHHHQRLQAALKGPVLGVSQMSRLYYYKNQFRIEAESGSTEA